MSWSWSDNPFVNTGKKVGSWIDDNVVDKILPDSVQDKIGQYAPYLGVAAGAALGLPAIAGGLGIGSGALGTLGSAGTALLGAGLSGGTSILNGLFGLKGTDMTNQANKEIADSTNATNAAIAEQNLGFQREVLDYQKGLQERIFNREDTAYQRTVSDMRAAGISPLAMQGANGAGEAIAVSPMHNSFQAQGYDYKSPLSTFAELAKFDPLGSLSTLMQIQGSMEDLNTKKLNNELLAKTLNYKVGMDEFAYNDASRLNDWNSKFGVAGSMTDSERFANYLIHNDEVVKLFNQSLDKLKPNFNFNFSNPFKVASDKVSDVVSNVASKVSTDVGKVLDVPPVKAAAKAVDHVVSERKNLRPVGKRSIGKNSKIVQKARARRAAKNKGK